MGSRTNARRRTTRRAGRWLTVPMAAGVGMALVACSGGGGDPGGGPGPGGGGTPDEASLVPMDAFSDEDVLHFLARTHFGARPSEHAQVVALGLPAYVDAMLTLPALNTTEWEALAFAELVDPTDPPGFEGMFPSTTDLARWWLTLMMHSEHPFQEALAFFWHDHFAVSSTAFSSQERHWIREYVDLLRTQGTGNLRTLLIEVSRNAAVAKWLDQTINDQFNINENYAREFWELFTLGVDNGYDDVDIRESSEAFTGLNVVFDAGTNLSHVEFQGGDHADGFKQMLGGTVEAQHGAGDAEHDDVEAVVDITLGFTGPAGDTATYVCRRLLEHFYGIDPPQALIDELAAILRNGWELRPVLATLFKSRAFYSERAKQPMVKSPVEASIGFMRSTGLLVPASRIDESLSQAGMRPTQPPDVDGWDTGTELLSSIAMLSLANMARDAVYERTYQQDVLELELASLLPHPGALAGEVIDHWTRWLRIDVTPAERALLVEYMDTRRTSTGDVVPSLFTAADPVHLDERLRGVLYVLAQHPNFMLR